MACNVSLTNTSSKQWRQGFGRCYQECKWVEIQLRPKLGCNKMATLALTSAAERLQCTRVSFQLKIPEAFYSVVFRTFHKWCCLIKIITHAILNSAYQMQYLRTKRLHNFSQNLILYLAIQWYQQYLIEALVVLDIL